MMAVPHDYLPGHAYLNRALAAVDEKMFSVERGKKFIHNHKIHNIYETKKENNISISSRFLGSVSLSPPSFSKIFSYFVR